MNTNTAPLSSAQKEEQYWANFYSEVQHTTPSTFAQFILSRPDTPRFIIDIGCGSGRDSFAFAREECHVVGIDRSHEGVLYATQYAEKQRLDKKLEFMRVDITDTSALQQALEHIKSKANNAPVLFYMRFFLHSITAEAQDNLLRTITANATNNDFLAVEFRTDKDEESNKVYGNHYRRFQNARAFSESLKNTYHFNVLFETEEKGLSPYKEEDPILYRAIAEFEN